MPPRSRNPRNIGVQRVNAMEMLSDAARTNRLYVNVDNYLRTNDAQLRDLRDTEVQERLQ